MSGKPSQAIVYCVTAEKYVPEFEISLSTVREFMPNIEVVVYTSLSLSPDLPCRVLPLEKKSADFSDKIETIKQADYDQILFLDADTFVADDCEELFSILDRFDLAAAMAPNRVSFDLPDVPASFPELNTGVLLIKRNERTKRFLDSWLSLFREHLASGAELPSQDQPSFRKALYCSDLRFAVLAPEYNCRFVVGANVEGKVKIFHGRANDHVRVRREVNTPGRLMIRWVKWERWR